MTAKYHMDKASLTPATSFTDAAASSALLKKLSYMTSS
jgi:hypothetical protein